MKPYLLLAALLLPISMEAVTIGSKTSTTRLSRALPFIANEKMISISGKFIIDVDHVFSGTIINMDPGSSTIINPNVTVAFVDTEIYCEDGMWYGIMNNGSISVSVCTIRDATTAVSILPGGQANIRRTDFHNNVIGVECTGNGFVSVDQCNFTADLGGLHNPYPNIFNTSYRGIFINGCTGYYNILSSNYFYKVQNGIVIENSTAISTKNDNNIYEHILPNSETASVSFGNAIQLLNSSLTQVGGEKYSNRGISSSAHNFINCYRGIYSSNSTLQVSNDDFDECVFGIVVTNSSNTNEIIIRGNTINKSRTAIDLYENKAPVAVKGSITNNTIKASPSITGSIGIRFVNSFSTTSPLIISRNSISIYSSASAGIVLSKVSYLTLHKNTVLVFGSLVTYAGIDIRNCESTVLSTNNVIGPSVVYKVKNDNNKVGIRVTDSEQTDMGCNSVTTHPVGMQFIGECDLSKIHGNIFKNGGVGLMIGDGTSFDAVVGNQVGMQNQWSGIFTKYKAWYSVDTGNPANIAGSLFFVDFAIPLFNPTSLYKSEVPGEAWFYDSPDSEKPSCGNFSNKSERSDNKEYTNFKAIMDIIARSILISNSLRQETPTIPK